MSDEESPMLREVATTVTVLRDIVIQLLVYEAKRHSDQRVFFEGFAKTTTRKIEKSPEGDPPPDATILAFQEGVFAELDDILGTARSIAMAPPGTADP
jgi:hypothetical protein